MSPAEFMRRFLPKTQARTPARAQASQEPNTKETYRLPERFPDDVEQLVARRSGGLCELDSCGQAVRFHYRRPPGVDGTCPEWVYRAANCLHLSTDCHLWVEGRAAGSSYQRSMVLGWLVSMTADVIAADVEVLYRGRLVHLTDTGIHPIPAADGRRSTGRPNFEEPRYGP